MHTYLMVHSPMLATLHIGICPCSTMTTFYIGATHITCTQIMGHKTCTPPKETYEENTVWEMRSWLVQVEGFHNMVVLMECLWISAWPCSSYHAILYCSYVSNKYVMHMYTCTSSESEKWCTWCSMISYHTFSFASMIYIISSSHRDSIADTTMRLLFIYVLESSWYARSPEHQTRMDSSGGDSCATMSQQWSLRRKLVWFLLILWIGTYRAYQLQTPIWYIIQLKQNLGILRDPRNRRSGTDQLRRIFAELQLKATGFVRHDFPMTTQAAQRPAEILKPVGKSCKALSWRHVHRCDTMCAITWGLHKHGHYQ